MFEFLRSLLVGWGMFRSEAMFFFYNGPGGVGKVAVPGEHFALIGLLCANFLDGAAAHSLLPLVPRKSNEEIGRPSSNRSRSLSY